ncbi:Bro-N domain-containing protein [Mycobacterium servetii]|uniref:Bro-N domain-containing protein n=1 Tax=Mycobacterium servetii TaxID=3237418 RepID=A0ABV4BZ37_9MYCO
MSSWSTPFWSHDSATGAGPGPARTLPQRDAPRLSGTGSPDGVDQTHPIEGFRRGDGAVELFTYTDQPVRVVLIDNEPWFVLADLCRVLDIANVGNVVDRLDDLNIRRADVENARGQMRQTVLVSEAAMYEVVIRSDKPEAVTFRRWITGEVLPSIRRTGPRDRSPAARTSPAPSCWRWGAGLRSWNARRPRNASGRLRRWVAVDSAKGSSPRGRTFPRRAPTTWWQKPSAPPAAPTAG